MSSPFPPLGPIKLPLPILLHATSFVGLGLYLIFRPTSPKTTDEKQNTIPTQATLNNPLAIPSGRAQELSSVLGLALLDLGLAHVVTSYVEVERNQFLYASVPIRLVVAGLAGVWLLVKGRGVSIEGRRQMWGLLVYDLVSVLALGWWLGEGGFSGRARVY